jgi:hypothetical protein
MPGAVRAAFWWCQYRRWFARRVVAEREPLLRAVSERQIVECPGAAHSGGHPSRVDCFAEHVRPAVRDCEGEHADEELAVRVGAGLVSPCPIHRGEACPSATVHAGTQVDETLRSPDEPGQQVRGDHVHGGDAARGLVQGDLADRIGTMQRRSRRSARPRTTRAPQGKVKRGQPRTRRNRLRPAETHDCADQRVEASYVRNVEVVGSSPITSTQRPWSGAMSSSTRSSRAPSSPRRVRGLEPGAFELLVTSTADA